VGSTSQAGEFQIANREPGRHTVILKHEKFKTLQADDIFLRAGTVDVQGAMEAVVTTGTIRFDVSPAGLELHLRIRRDGDAQEHEVPGLSATVPEGHYTVSASAAGYITTTTAVQINAGSTAVVTLPLRKAETPKAPVKTAPAPAFGLEDWVKTGWTQQANMVVHSGGNFVLAPLEIAQGAARFTVVLMKGKRVEFVAGFQDDKNYFFYQLDDKNLTRYQMIHGSKSAQLKVAHGLDRKEPMGVTINLTPGSLAVSVLRGGQWVSVDNLDVTGTPVHGKFGFHIPGSDELGLRDFQLTVN
jgi:hypothetical protein